jgi:uncharacterized protein (TIGR04222 family)
MSPFAMPEADFLALYAGLIGAGLVLALLLRWALRRPGGAPAEPPPLHPYEAALLAGGAAHAVNAAVAGLLQRGLLTLGESTGKLFPEGELPAEAHPLERRIHQAPPGTRVDRLAPFAAAETDALDAHLRELGLTLTAPSAAQARWAPVVLLLGVALFGAVRLAADLAADRSVALVALACAVPAAAAVLAWFKPPQRSRRGDRVLARLRARHEALAAEAPKQPDALPADDLTLAVGLFGVGVLATGPLAKLRRALRGLESGSETS